MGDDSEAIDLRRGKTPREWLQLLPWNLIYALGAVMLMVLITLLALTVRFLSSLT